MEGGDLFPREAPLRRQVITSIDKVACQGKHDLPLDPRLDGDKPRVLCVVSCSVGMDPHLFDFTGRHCHR